MDMFFKKHKYDILAALALIIAFFTLRFIYFTSLPIFTDEAIYMRWAQIALHDSSWRFISLTDGKQPMYIWVVMIVMKFIHDPLAAGRVVSVFSGFLTMIGLWFVTLELFKDRKAAFLTALLYIVFPFAQVQDRLAIYDSMVATLYVWTFYFSVLLVRRVNFGLAYTVGFLAGAGILTKSTNFFSLYLLPFTLLLFDFRYKTFNRRLFRWAIYAAFAAVIAEIFYEVLRLSPFFGIIAVKNDTFIFPFSEWIHHPFLYFIGNLTAMTTWFIQYMTIFLLALVLVGIFKFQEYTKEKLLLVVYFLFPFIALAFFGKAIFPRFIFFMCLMLFPIAGWGLGYIINKAIVPIKFESDYLKFLTVAAIILIFTAYPGFVSLDFAKNPETAPIAQSDKTQYVTNWTAGWGVTQSIQFFKDLALKNKINIVTEGTFGLMPETYEMYLLDNPNISVKGVWPITNQIPADVLEMAKKDPTYFVFYQPCGSCVGLMPPSTWKVEKVFNFQKGPTSDLSIYRVL